MLTIDINTPGFSEILGQLVAVTRRSAAEWLKVSGIRLVNLLMDSTPPFVSLGGTGKARGGTLKDRKVGEKAIAKVFNAIFKRFSARVLHDEKGELMTSSKFRRWRRWFFAYAKSEQADKMRTMLNKAGANSSNVVRSADASMHKRLINRRGKPRGRYSYVLRRDSIDRLLADTVLRIGKAKSTFLPALRGLGAKSRVASWITRHKGQDGLFTANLESPRAHVTFGSGAEWFAAEPKADGIVKGIMRQFELSMKRTLAVLMQRKVNTQFRGQTIRRRAMLRRVLA